MWSRVLRIEPGIIGIENNFFHLGGHSLRGTVLAARIEKEFNAAYPLSALFRAPFIRAAANTIKQAKRQIYSPLESVERKEYYPVSPIQKRLFIVHQLEGIGTAYNLVDAFIMEGPLDRQRLEQAFLQLIKRHESLRTSFHIVDGQPVQKIQEDFDFEFEYFDSKIDLVEVEVKVKAERKWQLPTSIINDFSRPFDFSRAPLLRVRLVRLAEDENSRLLLVDIHHIVTDGTSRSIFYRDLLAFYENRQLTGLSLQYKDFSQWQTRGKHKTGLESQEQYWLHRFKEKPPDSDIFTDFPRPPLQSFAGEVLSFTLEQKLMEKIDRLTKETGTTLFMVLLAVYSILLSKYTGQEDITVGTPVAGREHADLENLIGLFINALPMRNYPRRELTFAEFLGKVKENTLNAFENQGYPFDYLLEKLDIKVNMGRNPIFDVELVLLNMEQPRLETKQLTFIPCGYELHVTQVDLALYGIESEKEIELNLFYCTALFKRSTMERFINYFKEILWVVVEDRNIKLKDIYISYSLEGTKSDVYKDIEADLEF
jgi:hypothetical protein